jgi:hypothetical protein
MKRCTSLLLLFLCLGVQAQDFLSWKYKDRYFSLSLGTGAATYFGDLSAFRPNGNLSVANLGLEARLLTHFSARIEGSYYQISADDADAPEGSFEQQRNLKFASNNFEGNLQVLYYFKPYRGDYFDRWTWDPYVGIGLGITSYNPYTTLQGEQYFLRDIPTEPDKNYRDVALILPLTAGIKFKVNDFMNLNFELAYRFTNTDYLDDVATTFPLTYPNFTVEQLSNRKDEIPLVNTAAYDALQPGAKRGNDSKRDSYLLALLKVEFYLPNQLFGKSKPRR